MISKANGSIVRASYPSKNAETKQTKDNVNVSQHSDTNKIKELKGLIDSGKYKVDIEALSKKMADSLL